LALWHDLSADPWKRHPLNSSTKGLFVEILSLQFLSALLAIIVIDLVLAGDNAIVIALAARSLPQHLQRQAVIWGAVGAIVVRSTMTLVVVWLLKVPGLLFVGGVLLIWIAYRLLLPEDGESGDVKPATNFWGAIQTIVVADMVMGLDNVLAVAGAAHGSYLLVVLGLLISVPIVVWGSTILLYWVERHPGIVYFGAGVLAWTATKMITKEPFLKDAFDANAAATALLYLVVIGGVLWAGFVKNHRKIESRISTRLADLARKLEADRIPQDNAVVAMKGAASMQKVLVPVDGTRNSEFALQHVIKEFTKNSGIEIHLLNVQPPFSLHIAQFIGRKVRDSYHQDEAEKALLPARKLAEQHGIPYSTHFKVGDKAEVIVAEAKRLGCDRIAMSTARKNSITRMLEDSTTNRVIELTSVPVEVIAGDSVSKFERYGLPAVIAAALALLIASAIN
jgi:YjbE family integral membrane protein